MADYQKMYFTLFNAMSEATETMLLAMQQAEELYLCAEETPISLSKAACEARNKQKAVDKPPTDVVN